MFGKSQAKILKILWANFIKLFNHLIVFTSLHRPYYFKLPSSVSLWSNIRKHLLFSGSSRAETLLSQKQLIPTPFYLKSISMLLTSATLLYLSTIPSCMSAVGEETSESETSYCLRWKLFRYSSPRHLRGETFVSPSSLCLPFVFFVFAFLPIETTTANLQGLTHWNPSKCTNQVAQSNKNTNHIFWA